MLYEFIYIQNNSIKRKNVKADTAKEAGKEFAKLIGSPRENNISNIAMSKISP